MVSHCPIGRSPLSGETLMMLRVALGDTVNWCRCGLCNPSRLIYQMMRKR